MNYLSLLRHATLVGIIFAVLTLTGAPQSAYGQTQRLELGRRLQRFETAWETATAARRAACVPEMKAAVGSFFGLQLSAAGKHLDRAWHIVRGEDTVGTLEKSAVGWQVIVTPVCADVAQSKMEIRLTPFYESDLQAPEHARLRLQMTDSSQAVIDNVEFPLSEALTGITWETGALAAGDHRMMAELVAGDELFRFPEVIISRIVNFDNRLQTLQSTLADPGRKLDDTVRATIRDSEAVLKSMQAGRVQETDYPADERLRMCDALLLPEAQAREVFSNLARQSDTWLSLAVGRKSVPVRVRAPANSAHPLPVLFVFHGAGGSENMFFETYGAGRVIGEGVRRGWLVVAPRQSLFGLSLDIAAMLDALEQNFDIDRAQVMLLGHSMGAGQVLRQAGLHPDLPFAAVALGGGSRMANAERVQSIHWFVGAGDQDFGRSGAMQLHKSLEAAGVRSEYHDYRDVEHMVIVQAAIDDVFRFLDDTLKSLITKKAGTEPP